MVHPGQASFPSCQDSLLSPKASHAQVNTQSAWTAQQGMSKGAIPCSPHFPGSQIPREDTSTSTAHAHRLGIESELSHSHFLQAGTGFGTHGPITQRWMEPCGGWGWYLSPRKAHMLRCLAVSLGKFNYVHRGCSRFQDTPCSSRNELDASVPECISDSSQNAFHEHSKVVREALLAFWHFTH